MLMEKLLSKTFCFSDEVALLLDCGEECYGQLFRHYGDRTSAIINCIKIILISHMHADHHLVRIFMKFLFNKSFVFFLLCMIFF